MSAETLTNVVVADLGFSSAAFPGFVNRLRLPVGDPPHRDRPRRCPQGVQRWPGARMECLEELEQECDDKVGRNGSNNYRCDPRQNL
jgi:hypothetical protein